ncbi:bifunctional nicotinamidase/pyrazinamidase [Vibrio sp. S11_S32]|uniref:bifunctional nicotinamidase/pyrazinamidase n=1 Tax=Vibrio sp. S11_S32 TaxID=2720225 RepID=UPI00168089CF|nr:bifunctional nicotinamidase/pyrazinamidase [Vibrio sp. S11_S32]MBD1577600.1 bifunctional nicotinamidase/pyrazinamidase [Vibrio sp. S11_S32]
MHNSSSLICETAQQLDPSTPQTKALLIVDMQNSFVHGDDPVVHSMPVDGGKELVVGINALQRKFDLVLATKDWHPEDHGSFASQHPEKNVFDITQLGGVEQILWPDHCIQNSQGAEFVAGLNIDKIAHTSFKGLDTNVDSYSGFKDNNQTAKTDLDEVLKSYGVNEIYIVGLAADYCVKATAIDGVRLNYQTYLVTDLTKAVDPSDDNIKTLYAGLTAAGVMLITSNEL